MAERTARSNTLMVSVLAGLAGAGVALLLAPRSGRETREQLKSKAEDGLNTAKETMEHGVEKAKDASSHFASAIKHTGRQTKRQMDELKEEASDIKDTNWKEEV